MFWTLDTVSATLQRGSGDRAQAAVRPIVTFGAILTLRR